MCMHVSFLIFLLEYHQGRSCLMSQKLLSRTGGILDLNWFLWHDGVVLIFLHSDRPQTLGLRHLAINMSLQVFHRSGSS